MENGFDWLNGSWARIEPCFHSLFFFSFSFLFLFLFLSLFLSFSLLFGSFVFPSFLSLTKSGGKILVMQRNKKHEWQVCVDGQKQLTERGRKLQTGLAKTSSRNILFLKRKELVWMASRERGGWGGRGINLSGCRVAVSPPSSQVVPISELGLGSAKSSEGPAAGSTSMVRSGGVGLYGGGMDD